MIQKITYHGGNALSFAEYGDPRGFPILIQHGLIASLRDGSLFQRLVDLGTRPISIARPGYGESSPYVMRNMAEWGEVVSALVDALGLSQFDVLGISSGAPYGYSIGYRFPRKVRRIYILSGIPALYDDEILSYWPYPVDKQANLPELQKLARELFFSNLSKADLEQDDIRDSMMNDCFGIAQDLKLRCDDWGFRLSEVYQPVSMQHSQADGPASVTMAELTARRLLNCKLVVKEEGEHFSAEVLDEFVMEVMAEHYQ